jgi:hypothetical protein
MKHGFKTYKKIDVCIKIGDARLYVCSTKAYRTCKDAVQGVFEAYKGYTYKTCKGRTTTLEYPFQLKANFAE